jgi:hypothetical protein
MSAAEFEQRGQFAEHGLSDVLLSAVGPWDGRWPHISWQGWVKAALPRNVSARPSVRQIAKATVTTPFIERILAQNLKYSNGFM